MEDGDIYFNSGFGDLWIVSNNMFAKINETSITADPDTVVGFIKVGHADVETRIK